VVATVKALTLSAGIDNAGTDNAGIECVCPLTVKDGTVSAGTL